MRYGAYHALAANILDVGHVVRHQVQVEDHHTAQREELSESAEIADTEDNDVDDLLHEIVVICG